VVKAQHLREMKKQRAMREKLVKEYWDSKEKVCPNRVCPCGHRYCLKEEEVILQLSGFIKGALTQKPPDRKDVDMANGILGDRRLDPDIIKRAKEGSLSNDVMADMIGQLSLSDSLSLSLYVSTHSLPHCLSDSLTHSFALSHSR